MSGPGDHDAPWLVIPRVRYRGDDATDMDDAVAREEPLEIRVRGVALAVVMRTPGHDADLVRGFLLSEQIVTQPHDIVGIRHCDTVTDPRAEDNVVIASLRPEFAVDLMLHRRNLYATSSCGICGKASLERALARAGPLTATPSTPVSTEQLYALPDALGQHQPVFDRTGGIHGAALFTHTGQLSVVREDIGRHNAVDKVIGWAAASGSYPLTHHMLLVSGRVSFEIIQKALAARIPIVAGVSAPSSLAVELAREANMTLVGFLRERTMSIYTGNQRIARDHAPP